MPLTKYAWLNYPAHSLKSRCSVIRNNYPEYRTTCKQALIFPRQNDFYALSATKKAKPILNRHFSCPCSDTVF